jgi:hypothetical protein
MVSPRTFLLFAAMPFCRAQGGPATVDQIRNWPAPLYWQQPAKDTSHKERIQEESVARDSATSPTLGVPAIFVAMTPCRAVDTRAGSLPFGAPALATGEIRTYPLPASTACTIPAIAVAYSLNIAVVPVGTTMRWLTAWDTGNTQPNAATLNDKAGLITSNSAVVPAGAGGSINIFVTDATNLVMDINGYYAMPSALPLMGTPLAPALTFGDTATGIYSDTPGTVSISTEGGSRLTVRADGDLELPGSIRKNGVLFLQSAGQSTAAGLGSLTSSTGLDNTATGFSALLSNTSGSANTAMGALALQSNLTGAGNTAVGDKTLQANTIGIENTAIGASSLSQNTTGIENTATGASTLHQNTSGAENTGNGFASLFANTTGAGNTATGFQALNANTLGSGNTASGVNALVQSASGNNNTAVGNSAGFNLITGSSNVYIANRGAEESNAIRIGDVQTQTFVAGIRGVTTGNADAVAVMIDSNGQLGTASSSRRVKRDIQDMGDTTGTILSLHPVRFRYLAHAADAPMQYGLVAEEVDEIAPELVAHTAQGEVETVYYDKINAMLLNEVQKLHRLNEQLESRIVQLENRAR